MSENDFERELRAAFRDNVDQVAAPALHARIYAVPQDSTASMRRRWGVFDVNRAVLVGVAACAALAVAVGLGLALLTAPEVGPPSVASPLPGTSSSPTPSQRANVPGDGEPIAPGRTQYRRPWGFSWGSGNWIPGELILTMPSGWAQVSTSRGSGMDAASTGLRVGVAGPVWVEPCAEEPEEEPQAGMRVEEFVAAVTSVAELEATDRRVTLAGFPGSMVSLTVPARPNCDRGYGWDTGARGDVNEFLMGWVEGFEMPWEAGSHHELWVLDVDGVTFVLDASYGSDATAAAREELRDIAASAEFELYPTE